MAELGQVMEIKGNHAIVRLERQEACAKCQACTLGTEVKDMILETENLCGAKVNDIVEVSLDEGNFIKAVAIMYVLPFLGLVAGLGLGYLIGQGINPGLVEIIAVIGGFLLMAVVFLVIRANEPKFRTKKYRPSAVRVAFDGYEDLGVKETEQQSE
ncbi:SoxR reducing system RseC family protein [Anaerotalea alkaliphila]|uniref:SoxR reducing system RseC family protein n=1 Tax=Anaerotalea alkaliphila TaxID=2662126 RepID=A0A7X5HVV5_9FIRM|nr:SoxR reducing system RseC family protein [Anaerotalea alkaliphila]NDL67610.1 SoxR reducing system RseC family protein [Anaerotalea alkaliphila]